MVTATGGWSVPPVVEDQGATLTGDLAVARFPGVSVEFVLVSLVVVLIPGIGVIYAVSGSICGKSRGLIATVGCTLGIVPRLLAARLGLVDR